MTVVCKSVVCKSEWAPGAPARPVVRVRTSFHVVFRRRRLNRPRSLRRRPSLGRFQPGLLVEILQQIMSGRLDVLMPPLGGAVDAGDQAGGVETSKIPVHKGIPRLRVVRCALGQSEMPLAVLVPGVRLRGRRFARRHAGGPPPIAFMAFFVFRDTRQVSPPGSAGLDQPLLVPEDGQCAC